MTPRTIETIHEMEAKWQKTWEEAGTYAASTGNPVNKADKFYGLVEFPYPSGEGLHVGHPRSYTAIDLVTRKRRMEGKNVLYPMGWDAFGLPTENFAIKHKIRPADATKKNVANFTRQIKSLGFGFDWTREVNTTDPAYYKWTQWQFLQFVKAGLAYKAKSTINWCPKCKIGLANEEAQGGVCERCGTPVEKREKAQWMIKISKYADRLIDDLGTVNYLEKIAAQQVNWIGRSEGAEVIFKVADSTEEIKVFTTRPDTLFGVTYVVLAPEHEFVETWIEAGRVKNADAVRAYVETVKSKTDMERTSETKDKTGVALEGVFVTNPVNGEKLPVWIADYVLAGYGTGAVMAVPAHDERDYAFANAHGLAIRQVVKTPQVLSQPVLEAGVASASMYGHLSSELITNYWTGDGEHINSGFLNGLDMKAAKETMIKWLEEHGAGKRAKTYKLRDWVFSRQRYWGEPIPLVHCDACANKRQKVLLVHGFSWTAENGWYPSMKRSLEETGFEVLTPTLPCTNGPSVEQWMDILKPYIEQLGEEDIVVGHSIGGRAILEALEQTQKRIGRLILVAPAIGEYPQERYEERLAKEPTRKADFDFLRDFVRKPVQWDKVRSLMASAVVMWSTDDRIIAEPTHQQFPAGWYIHRVTDRGHFHLDEQPEILEQILAFKNTGWIPVPDNQLPLTLPEVDAYEPTDNGDSPLAKIDAWVNTTCPKCGGPATRETDTMPNWAGSSWYFLRYCDPHNDKEFASAEALKYWLPVDLYNGGMEHTTLHLLYSRFWHKFLYDMGYIPAECGSEPYSMRRSHDMILGEGGVKMSKSKGNVVNPDDVVKVYGADVFRVYEMFIGPYDQKAPWDTNGVEGVRRFLDRIWYVFHQPHEALKVTAELETLFHQTVKKVTDGIDNLQFNTCVSQMMILANAYQDFGGVPTEQREAFLQILAPFAPHVTEELWQEEGKNFSIHRAGWPTYDANKLVAATFELVIQVNGKVRDKVVVDQDISEEAAKKLALESEAVQKWFEGKVPQKVVYVKGRLVSVVV